MKIRGEQPGLNRAKHTLRRADGRAWTVILQALPYGFPEKNARDLPQPAAPVEVVRDRRGAVVRDDDGTALTTHDRQNQPWRAEVERINALRMVHAFVTALSADPAVTWENAREKFPTTREWIEAVEQEIIAAGITDAEISEILAVVADLNRGLAGRMDQAAEDFLPGTQSDSAGKSPRDAAEPSSI
jgi:hypothetical protein